MPRLTFPLLAALLLAANLGGCNPNNGGGEPNDPNTGGNTPPTLTAAQQAVINTVTEQLTAAAAIFSTSGALANAQLDLDSMSAIGAFGTCPAVAFVASSETATAQFDFGSGCSVPTTGGHTISGAVTLTIARGSRSATLNFNQLTIDGNAITGTMNVTVQAISGGVRLTGTCNLATATVGTINGSITIELTTNGLVTIGAGSVTVSDGSTAHSVTLANLVLDPVNNGNFVPEAGTATFQVPDGGSGAATLTAVVTFDAQSPQDGTVQVKLGNAPAVEYQIPGIP